MLKMTRALLGASVILICAAASAQTPPAKPGTGEPAPAASGQPASKPAKSVVDYLRDANSAYQSKDYHGYLNAVRKLTELRPNNVNYMIQLVIAAALTNEKSLAYSTMLNMQQQGAAYDFTQTPDTQSIRDTEVFQYLNKLLTEAGNPVGKADTLFQLAATTVLPNALAWDPGRKAWLVGTAREGALLRADARGKVTELLRADEKNGLWGIYGLQVDTQNNRLWVASDDNPVFAGYQKDQTGHSALFEFRLDTLELVRRIPVPDDGRPHQLGEMVQTPNGDLFLIDRVFPNLYRLAAGEHELRPFLASGDLVSLRDITTSPDGSKLYVADYEMGVMVVDLVARKVAMLEMPPHLNPGGIDGLCYWNQHLVVVQGGFKPQRVMRLALDAPGRKVSGVAAVAVALPEFDRPELCAVKDNQLAFFANTQHPVDKQGSLSSVRVLGSDLDSVADMVAPNVDQMLRQQAEKHRQAEKQAPPGEGGQ